MEVAKISARRSRSTLTIDLGALKDAVVERSSAEHQSPSAWIRAAVQAKLSCGLANPSLPPSPTGPARSSGVYRAWLNEKRTAKLDLALARSGHRSRADLLDALIDGLEIGVADGSASSLSAAAGDLCRSNHLMVGVATRLRDLLTRSPASATYADAVATTVDLVRNHLDPASRLLAVLMPMVRIARMDGPRAAGNPDRKDGRTDG